MRVTNIGTGVINIGSNTSFVEIRKGETVDITDSQWRVLRESHFMDSIVVDEYMEPIRSAPIKLSDDCLSVEKI
jgi:hypothetical protein